MFCSCNYEESPDPVACIHVKGGHDIQEGHCVRTVHAEVNAVTQAARLGIPTEGATLYCNTRPCRTCFKVLISAGITEIVYRDEYGIKDNYIEKAVEQLGGSVVFRAHRSSETNEGQCSH
jgi:deoxycytidylate deaminase